VSIQWIDRGYQTRITDPAPLAILCGLTKIDTVQNVNLLRSDLHDAWVNYRLAVNPGVCLFSSTYPRSLFYHTNSPQRGYVVIPFIPGYNDVVKKILKLDHITDINLRPLDDICRDHFLQGVLKNMKGIRESTWDYEDVLGGGTMDLSRLDVWGDKSEHLEFEMAHRLHNLQVT
jgi:hypothetical protein